MAVVNQEERVVDSLFALANVTEQQIEELVTLARKVIPRYGKLGDVFELDIYLDQDHFISDGICKVGKVTLEIYGDRNSLTYSFGFIFGEQKLTIMAGFLSRGDEIGIRLKDYNEGVRSAIVTGQRLLAESI